MAANEIKDRSVYILSKILLLIMETTVTMSLERYKSLEALEKSFELMKQEKSFVVFGDYDRYYCLNKDEAMKELLLRDQSVQARINRIRDRFREYIQMRKRPDPEAFFNEVLYY